MARGKAWDKTTKAIVISLIKEGRSADEIAEAVGSTPGTIRSFWWRERQKQGEIRECASCGKTIKDTEAVFCPYCGKKILTEKDRVMEHLNDIGKCIGEFPNSFRDRIMANVNEIRKYIKGH
jgi:DNA-directed RNA polymerase subunit RPC12/RpoP